MTREPILICRSEALAEGGNGIRFAILEAGHEATGFVVRYDGIVRGYLNRCAHVPMELDWSPGEFFDSSGLYLMCATHGALYEPDSGRCAGGPCKSKRLRPISVSERDDGIFWHPDEFLQPPSVKGDTTSHHE